MHIGVVSPCSSGPLADLFFEPNAPDLGWGGHFIATLVRALIGLGHKVSVITLSPAISEKRVLTGPALTYYVYPMRNARRMRDLYSVEREALKEGIGLANPDLLHAHWTYEFAFASLETGLPTLVTSHDNAVRVIRYTPDLYRLGRLFMQLYVLSRARFITAVSPYVAQAHKLFTCANVKVIPNAVDLPKNVHAARKQESGPVKIATVLNGFVPLKNPKGAIAAFKLLRGSVPDAELHMFGSDFEPNGPAAGWAARNRLADGIRFRGAHLRTELHAELEQMTVLLHPSLEEACPLAVLEAMAVGVPVVAGRDSGGVPWVLDHGRAGFLTDIESPRTIAHTLLTCIRNVEERSEKQQLAYDRVVEYFSPQPVATQYEKEYKALLSWAS
jgi:L-malate glycosyltransferase